MEDIALVALPPTVDSDVESDSGSESAEEPEVDGTSKLETGLKESEHEELKPNAFDGIMAPKGGITSLPSRVKLYTLLNNDWEDQGTGLCTCAMSDTGAMLGGTTWMTVDSEDDPNTKLLHCYPSKYDGFQKQQDKFLVWTQKDGTDTALSFQEPDGCTSVWNVLLIGGVVDEVQETAHTKLTSHLEEEETELHQTSLATEDQDEEIRRLVIPSAPTWVPEFPFQFEDHPEVVLDEPQLPFDVSPAVNDFALPTAWPSVTRQPNAAQEHATSEFAPTQDGHIPTDFYKEGTEPRDSYLTDPDYGPNPRGDEKHNNSYTFRASGLSARNESLRTMSASTEPSRRPRDIDYRFFPCILLGTIANPFPIPRINGSDISALTT
ncbi:Platinum sensitivity protein [Neodidymelliopsis sp. IMI 364377]|nr:Platinum sensitivity protein [Neodidymelliopsis sp. IMI 364377]